MLDGVAVGVAFRSNAALGAVVAAAIIAHDFSDGVTTVTLLLSQKHSRRSSLYWLLIDGLAPLLGIGLTFLIHLSTNALSLMLGGFAGMFLYMGATHLLPEAHAVSDSWVTVAGMIVGVAVMALVAHWV
jgi:zinc transporter ZupT